MAVTGAPLRLNVDRLLPAEPAVRAIARRLYEAVRDLPLISPRHARVLWREGRHVFEDLRSARGSFRHGQQVDVRFIESGDEFDLGGFLPVRFRLV